MVTVSLTQLGQKGLGTLASTKSVVAGAVQLRGFLPRLKEVKEQTTRSSLSHGLSAFFCVWHLAAWELKCLIMPDP